jgi:hypothetical protein
MMVDTPLSVPQVDKSAYPPGITDRSWLEAPVSSIAHFWVNSSLSVFCSP